MGDIDATSTAAPSTVPAPPEFVDGIIGNTPSAPAASEPGSGGSGEPCADVKTEKAAEGAPAARLPLKQAVELEMKNLSDATERIDADTAFMHYLIDRRREYLIETLQKLKYNRGKHHTLIHTHGRMAPRGTAMRMCLTLVHTHCTHFHTFHFVCI